MKPASWPNTNGIRRCRPMPGKRSRSNRASATVVVLPEAEEVEVAIDPDRLKVEVFRSTGHGGQSVNTTDSAVRLTYLPEDGSEPIVASSQDERSQLKNRARAMKVLLARVLDRQLAKQQAALTLARRSAVGTGDRSEKIRTYNYPEARIT